MASLITSQFERYVAEQTIAQGAVVFDEFIFANIPGLNADNLAQHLTMPSAAQIVHRQTVSKSGVINENAVVYSVTIGTEIGDFDFNFIGLINKSKNLLAVAVQTDTVRKTRNKNAVQGNSITRNILLEFSGAKALTGINVSAQTWQIDFTVRLHGLDEKIRLTNRDLYGRAVFFDDGFLVQRKTGNQFTIKPGVAYVEGVRMDSTALYNLTANSLPCSVYADVVHHCTVTGEYKTEIKYLTQSKTDYVDTANRQHYVQILADIDSAGNVTDRRLLSPFLGITPLELSETTENHKDSRGHSHKLPIASLVKRGIVKLFSGYDADSEEMAATPKAIKGLKALIDAITRNLGNYIPNSKKSNATNSASSDTVATSAAVKSANDNANGRVPKTGDTTIAGTLRTQHPNLSKGNWSCWQWATREGYWQLEVHPDSHDSTNRRFNMLYLGNNGDRKYLTFPTIGDGATVAYQDWVREYFVKKTGDTMTGKLIIEDESDGSHSNAGIALINKGNSGGTAVHYDAHFQANKICKGGYHINATANGGATAGIMVTPDGDKNRDRRITGFTVNQDGTLWSHNYGWLHDYFVKQSWLNQQMYTHYPQHYEGAVVYKIPLANGGRLMITTMRVTVYDTKEVNLPENYTGVAIPMAVDVGDGRHSIGISMVGGNKVIIHNRSQTGCHVYVIGWTA